MRSLERGELAILVESSLFSGHLRFKLEDTNTDAAEQGEVSYTVEKRIHTAYAYSLECHVSDITEDVMLIIGYNK